MRALIAGVVGAALLGVVACGSTPSPDPSAAVAPSSASATPGAVVDGAAFTRAVVARLQAEPFVAHVEQIADAITTETTEDGKTVERPNVQLTASYDFSGDDMRASLTVATTGVTRRSEMAAVGDTFWSRDDESDWVAISRSAEVQQGLDEMYQTVRITDDPAALQYIGLETLDGEQLHHLSALPGRVPYASGTFDALDLYVRADGTPVLLNGKFTTEAPGVVVEGTTAVAYSSFGGPISIEPPVPTP
ncbi:MAG TPA: hypothetical protein VES19_10200 [Candidatus Limnocylindrales bacterium]|nr:hypothetical protein [Candidatus Limnocylindrales bacterium]